MSDEYTGEACFVIHSRPYLESSMLVDLLGLNCGRITAVARGALRPTSLVRGCLQLFTPLKAHVARSRGSSGLWKLRACQAEGRAYPLVAPAVFCATYLNELLYHLWRVEEGSPLLFACYMQTLQTLAQPDLPQAGAAAALRRFELTLLETLGYGIDFTGDGPGGAFTPGGSYSYEPERGFRIAPDPELVTVFEGRVLNDLRAGRLTAGAEHAQALQQITTAMLERLLGKHVIISRKLYRGYLQAQRRAAGGRGRSRS